VTIIEAEPEECFDLLVSEHADVAVVVATDPLPPRGDSRFEQSALFSDRLDLLVPTDHSLAKKSAAALSDAAEEAWILGRLGCRFPARERASVTGMGDGSGTGLGGARCRADSASGPPARRLRRRAGSPARGPGAFAEDPHRHPQRFGRTADHRRRPRGAR